MSRDPEVLVVGAGPVGLASALFLRRHGVRVAVIDTHQRTTQHSYALAIHPRTLRVLDEAGLSGRLLGAGRTVTSVAFHDGAGRRAGIDYTALGPAHPHLLLLRQSVLERALEDALREQDVAVLWGHRLQALDAGGAVIQAEVETLDHVATGYPVARSEWVVSGHETIRPAFVIGADGFDSAVRRMTGIEMIEQGPAQVFSVYEIEATGELPADVRVILDADLTSVYWPLEDGRCRWGFQIRDAAEHEPSMARLERLLAARASWFTARPTRIYWSTAGLFESRLAGSFGAGHVWLAGDAAHQAGPVGVHSMNAGLVEARDLANGIAGMLRDGPSPEAAGTRARAGGLPALQATADGARQAWQDLFGAADRGAVRAADGTDPWVRQHGARILACLPASGEDLAPLLAQIGLSAGLRAGA